MIPIERQKKIINLIHQHQILGINELVDLFQVSHMTIRRDIKKLEDEGKIITVSGGIQLHERLASEPTRIDKSLLFYPQKQRIGAKAAELIKTNSTIYLDAGTTTLEIAKRICQREDLLVITNDFVITEFLSEQGKCQLIHTGGFVNKPNHSSVGELAAQFLRNISIDMAFISTSSWNIKGLTTPDENKIPVKRAIIQSSHHKILVSDSSKYGKVATFFLFPLTNFNKIICDKDLIENAQNAIQETNIELMLV